MKRLEFPSSSNRFRVLTDGPQSNSNGNRGLVGTQLIAVGVTVLFAVVGTAVILIALKAVMGLRVSEQDERMGLDLSQPSESAYVLAYDYDEGPSSMPIHHSSEEREVTSIT